MAQPGQPAGSASTQGWKWPVRACPRRTRAARSGSTCFRQCGRWHRAACSHDQSDRAAVIRIHARRQSSHYRRYLLSSYRCIDSIRGCREPHPTAGACSRCCHRCCADCTAAFGCADRPGKCRGGRGDDAPHRQACSRCDTGHAFLSDRCAGLVPGCLSKLDAALRRTAARFCRQDRLASLMAPWRGHSCLRGTRPRPVHRTLTHSRVPC